MASPRGQQGGWRRGTDHGNTDFERWTRTRSNSNTLSRYGKHIRARSSIHSLSHSLTHSLTQIFTHSITILLTFSLLHTLSYSLSHLLSFGSRAREVLDELGAEARYGVQRGLLQQRLAGLAGSGAGRLAKLAALPSSKPARECARS